MSRERFEWLERWVADPSDIIRTPGTESNVKEIYDECARLDEDPENIVFNQFCEFGNHLVHYLCTGRALEHVFETLEATAARPHARGLRVGHRLGGHDRRGRLPEGPLRHAHRRPSRRWSARRCSTTASASTTSRASATSTCRSSTT